MLQWQHAWGAKADHWDALLKDGRRVPDGYLDKPEVLPAAAIYWSAFSDLGSERTFGMVVGPIPWSKARDYAWHHGFVDHDQFERFWMIIRTLDGEQSRLNSPPKRDKSPPQGKKPAPLRRGRR